MESNLFSFRMMYNSQFRKLVCFVVTYMNGFLCCLRLSDLTVNVYDFVVIWSLSKHRALVLNVLFTAQCVKLLFSSLTELWGHFVFKAECSFDIHLMSLSCHTQLNFSLGYVRLHILLLNEGVVIYVFSGRMIASWICSSRTSYKTISIQYRSHTLSVTMAWPLFNTSVVMFLRRE